MITVIDERTNDDTPGASSPSNASLQETKNERTTLTNDPTKVAPAMASFPVPPTMANPPNNSDLMSRLRNFLPQMESANKELLSMPRMGDVDTDPVRLDTNLELNEASDSDDDDESGNDGPNPLIQEVGKDQEQKSNNPDGVESASEASPPNEDNPTIQLEFTMGNMTGNPLMKLLANDDDEDDDDDSNSENDDDNDPTMCARKNAIANLLTESEKSNNTEKKNNVVLLDTIAGGSAGDGSKKKKTLITEIS